jgi:Mn-dependent DtxR family transcriptional regulator
MERKGMFALEIRQSAEDYLETILLLGKKTGSVRSIDIVNEMGFSKPSVSIAMKKLRESALIEVDDEGRIILTEAGLAEAEQVYERHSTLYEWLVQIGVSTGVAAADACRMEHVISPETFDAIRRNIRDRE